jgi:methyl-accepting chemotaxis protein
MSIESGFQVRLGIYRIDSEIMASRSEIWTLLAPHLGSIVEAYLANVVRCAPIFRKRMEDYKRRYLEEAETYTRKLLNNPLDENWIKDAYERAALEIANGLDMRSRGSLSIYILAELNNHISKRHRFSPQKGFRLVDAATRILMLDAANAVACHNSIEVDKSKARANELANAIQEFGRTVEGVRRSVVSAVKSLGSTSDELAALAGSASGQVNTATQGADDTAFKISTIAAATEQLSASIEEMHAQTIAGAEAAKMAVSDSDRANANIRFLSESVEKIGSVVGLISKIAAQTNLLALNATIEAARAGEAGRGFAVVASEVKSLAIQTAKATRDVGEQIGLIQEAMRRSMDQISSTSRSIGEISGSADVVAQTVMQQASATNEIAKNANGVAENATTVAAALKMMQATILRTEEATKLVLNFTGDLSLRSGEIGNAMDTLFKAAAEQSGVRKFTDLAAVSP